jgi:hypothetical protein
MGKRWRGFYEPRLGAADCDKGRIDETVAQGLRLQRAFMSISDAADREAVVRFAIERARGKHAELDLVAHS